jgi:hypothetical protein
MSDLIQKASQATPSGDLLRDLLDTRIAKSEREWAASREIERLRAENVALKEELLREREASSAMKEGAAEMLRVFCKHNPSVGQALSALVEQAEWKHDD